MAQTETSQITGTVFDPAGAVVSGAKITATEAATGATRSATSSSTGTYVIPNVLPGTYEVTATAPGFRTVKQRIAVPVGAKVGADMRMEIGDVNTVVQVAENAVQLNTETQTLSQNISGREVLELPTITRNLYDLVLTAGNVSAGDSLLLGTPSSIRLVEVARKPLIATPAPRPVGSANRAEL